MYKGLSPDKITQQLSAVQLEAAPAQLEAACSLSSLMYTACPPFNSYLTLSRKPFGDTIWQVRAIVSSSSFGFRSLYGDVSFRAPSKACLVIAFLALSACFVRSSSHSLRAAEHSAARNSAVASTIFCGTCLSFVALSSTKNALWMSRTHSQKPGLRGSSHSSSLTSWRIWR